MLKMDATVLSGRNLTRGLVASAAVAIVADLYLSDTSVVEGAT